MQRSCIKMNFQAEIPFLKSHLSEGILPNSGQKPCSVICSCHPIERPGVLSEGSDEEEGLPQQSNGKMGMSLSTGLNVSMC